MKKTVTIPTLSMSQEVMFLNIQRKSSDLISSCLDNFFTDKVYVEFKFFVFSHLWLTGAGYIKNNQQFSNRRYPVDILGYCFGFKKLYGIPAGMVTQRITENVILIFQFLATVEFTTGLMNN